MSKIINVEKAQYLSENISTYAQNKVGEYSKFLDKTPFFVTYLAINSNLSRHDVGTGGVASDIGPKSPIRYNQINHFPVFNIPDLKPDIEFDESGYNIQLEINDGVILPNTIKPKVGDYIIISLPNMVELVFRVNQPGYNTIQSNDFYTFSADLKFTGENQISRFNSQIVEEYETIFDNIGTEDKCFILVSDVEKLKNIGKLIEELKSYYLRNFFDSETGCFVCKVNDEDIENNGYWYYDKYVEKFIMDSEIYLGDNQDSIALAPADIIEQSELWYPRTLFYAILKKDTSYLGRFPYCYQVPIQKLNSVFNIFHIKCKSINLHITDYELFDNHSDGLDSEYLYRYFPHGLIREILDNDDIDDNIEHKYDPHSCWKDDKNIEYDYERPYELTYLDEIIYNYLSNIPMEIDRKKLISFTMKICNYTYKVMPMIIYIITEYYNSYFKTDKNLNL